MAKTVRPSFVVKSELDDLVEGLDVPAQLPRQALRPAHRQELSARPLPWCGRRGMHDLAAQTSQAIKHIVSGGFAREKEESSRSGLDSHRGLLHPLIVDPDVRQRARPTWLGAPRPERCDLLGAMVFLASYRLPP
jgi:hypothetical protein